MSVNNFFSYSIKIQNFAYLEANIEFFTLKKSVIVILEIAFFALQKT